MEREAGRGRGMLENAETVTESEKPNRSQTVPFAEIAGRLKSFPAYAASDLDKWPVPGTVEVVHLEQGGTLTAAGDSPLLYSVVLQGSLQAERLEQDGTRTAVGQASVGEGFGETPILHGKKSSTFFVVAKEPSEVVRFSQEQFWGLLACCPAVRETILQDFNHRLQTYQVEALHREKLVTLGTLAAGLMHELHNPGSAAKRSAALLRENLLRLQEVGLRISEHPKTLEQLQCMKGLLQHTVKSCRMAALSSVEQADAEEAMSEWLASSGVENAYAIGPVLVGMGFDTQELGCAKEYFDTKSFSDALNWLGALVSSMSQVCAIEESIGRISELVMAVKKYAYDEKMPTKEIDVHDSLQSTLTILGHKLRIKQIKVEKSFAATPSTIVTKGSALSQVWTNLIDNAADASPANGQIEITTWTEPEWLAVQIGDHGSGIPEDVRPHIFEAFFTTKPQGSGTGLGLEIVHRIVTQKFGGKIDVESKPGDTRFIVRLPRKGS
ncbi:cyclic nucleotide-binding domain-containing protein [Acidobacteria bacterium AB60]|nr:cyclic nucleotide-binding domain-containing protein [Acidobacteria bacterium AB60]